MSQLTKNTTDLDALITKANALPDAVDTSDADATADDIVSPRAAYVNGERVTGNIPSKSSSDLTVSGATVNVPAGHYKQAASKAVPTATQATPSIEVNSSGLITAKTTQPAGYVAAGTKSGTKQLTTQAAKTVTPTTSEQTVVAAGRYTTGAIKVAKIPSDYIKPSGTKTITENGTHDVTSFAAVNVNVPTSGGGGGAVETCTVTLILSEWATPMVQFVYESTDGATITDRSPNGDIIVVKNSLLSILFEDNLPVVSGGVEIVYESYSASVLYITGDGSIEY